MKDVNSQMEIIKGLIGCDFDGVVKEDGCLSRGIVIDGGRLIFKFPRNKDVSYRTEIENLRFLNDLNLGVKLQKVAYESVNDEYLGVYGVKGGSLADTQLSDADHIYIGKQLGKFLKKLHNVNKENRDALPLLDEIIAWQNRVTAVESFIASLLNNKEQAILRALMFDYMPKALETLGERIVFSHGDLGDENIIIDKDKHVGIIDFNESGFLDEGADFMDLTNEILVDTMLDAYGADEALRKKVEIRRDIRPIIVLEPFLVRNDEKRVDNAIKGMHSTINKYSFLLY